MGRPHKHLRPLFLAALLAATAARPEPPSWEDAVRQAARLARDHRYTQVVSLLEPLASADLPEQGRFEVEAELGRALFHLGRYADAWEHLVEAARIQPRRIEVALYLEAAAWVTGRREQARAIFEGILASGARDLYLAVTLPGERGFLSDAGVREILRRHRRPLVVDPGRGTFAAARLGEPRASVAEALGMSPGTVEGDVLTARAGPRILWALRFGGDGLLRDVVVHVDNVDRYTPYALRVEPGLGPGSTPAEAMVSLGAPASTTPVEDGAAVLRWELSRCALELEFGLEEDRASGGAATLRMVRLSLR